MMDGTVGLDQINVCAPFLPVSGIFTAGTETLLSQCVMEKYSSIRGAMVSFPLLSGLGHSKSKTIKDKAVSTGSVPQLCVSFILPRSLGQKTRLF